MGKVSTSYTMRHLTIIFLTLYSASALTEENIVGSDRFTDTPQDCQNICREAGHSDCVFFTHFNTECYLLSACDTVELCDGCLSGPANPLLSDCQETTIGTTTMPPTTMGTTIGTTTATAVAPGTTGTATTTGWITSTTTMMPTTTTMADTTLAPCDVTEGVICDDLESLIEHIEHISHASDCQAICQIYPDCGRTTSHECHDEGTHECPPQPPYQNLFQPLVHGREPRPGPGGPKCHCQSGGNSPDLDECDNGSSGCEDY